MNCLYCQQPIDGHPSMGPDIIYYCDYCFVNFHYSTDDKLTKMIWYRYLPTGKFTFGIDYQNNKFMVSHQNKNIIDLSFIPNWTPKNSERKLKLYLPFI